MNFLQNQKLVLGLIVIAIGVLLIWYGGVNKVLNTNSKTPDSTALTAKPPLGLEQGLVVRVVDGDTIEVNLQGQNIKVRYLGMNTPETVDPRRPVQCFGKEASNENKSLVEGKTVLLEKDITDKDKFDRLLRYVYLRQDNGQYLFVNDYLVRTGFAQTNTFPPDVKYTQRFGQAETEARQNNLGLWKACKHA